MSRKKEVSASTEKPAKPPKVVIRKPKSPAPVMKKDSANTLTTISPTERHSLIAQTAYLRAEKRGFCGGDPQEDWLIAETEVDQYLKQMQQ